MAALDYADLYYEAFLAGQRNAAALTGTDIPEPLPPDVEQSLRKRARQQAAQLEEMVVDSPEAQAKVAQKLAEWMGGEGPLSQTDLARALEPEFGLTRALTIARTETAQAFEASNAAQIEAAGFEWMEWSAALDACPLCLALDGQVMSIADFQQYRADAHPNCACIGLPSDAMPGSDYALENPFEPTDFEREAPEAVTE